MTEQIKMRFFEMEDESLKPFLYYPLLPNNIKSESGRRPLSLALKKGSNKCLEYMLELLMFDQGQDYLRFVEPYIFKLLSINSPIFNLFLEQSCRRI